MANTLGRIEPRTDADQKAPDDPAGPPSPHVLRELHRDLVAQKRRAFLKASPLLLLAAFGWLAGITAPREFSGILFLSSVALLVIGRIGVEWLQLRRADPVALYEREMRQAEIHKVQQIEHMIRSADVVPVATLSLVAVIVIVTVVQFMSGPLAATVASAGLVKPAVRAGEWWRLLTATYLHGNLFHLVSNMGAALAIGRVIETYDRRLRLPAVYLVSAIAGSVASTLATSQPSVGASGGVLGLIGYVLVAAGRQPGGMPAWVRREMASMLASTALLGIAAFLFIDNAAHAGGTAAGAAMGYVATRASRDRSLDPWDAAGVAAAIVLAAGAVFTIARLR